METRGSALARLLDWVNKRSVARQDISADDVRRLQEVQRADETNKDRQVWVHGGMNGRH
ncbi:MAG: hypothetical protein M0Z54_00965 [Thermaerobacter sp.]|nr:hypothetical protein [Thermaerobacter sp.]